MPGTGPRIGLEAGTNLEEKQGTGSVFSDGVTIQGTGTLALPIAIKAVQHDASLVGNGTVLSPLKVSPNANGYQSQRYTAVGGEVSVTITLPVARTNNLYNARAFGCGLAFQLTFDCPATTYTNTQFTFIPSAPLTVGDVVGWEIENLT